MFTTISLSQSDDFPHGRVAGAAYNTDDKNQASVCGSDWSQRRWQDSARSIGNGYLWCVDVDVLPGSSCDKFFLFLFHHCETDHQIFIPELRAHGTAQSRIIQHCSSVRNVGKDYVVFFQKYLYKLIPRMMTGTGSQFPLKFGDCLIACSVTAGISIGIIPTLY